MEMLCCYHKYCHTFHNWTKCNSKYSAQFLFNSRKFNEIRSRNGF